MKYRINAARALKLATNAVARITQPGELTSARNIWVGINAQDGKFFVDGNDVHTGLSRDEAIERLVESLTAK